MQILYSNPLAPRAANAIMRMLGTSFSNLESRDLSAIKTISKLYLPDHTTNIRKGLYKCDFSEGMISGRKIDSKGGGHNAIWNEFKKKIDALSGDLASKTATKERQSLILFLNYITSDFIIRDQCWLSTIRNKVNYQHEFGIWFPYSRQSKDLLTLFDRCNFWKENPGHFDQIEFSQNNLEIFVQKTNMIISLCRVMIIEMSNRCSSGRSFHFNGGYRLLNNLQIAT